MSMNAAIGISEQKNNSFEAGMEAIDMALRSLSEEPSLVIVFASSHYHHEDVVAGVRSKAPFAVLIGGSTAGEITNHSLSSENTVGVMAIHAPDLALFPARSADIAKVGSHEAGRSIADSIMSEADAAQKILSFIMIFPDILAGNGADMVRGMLTRLGSHFPIIGGATGDDQKFEKTYQYIGDDVISGHIVGVGVSGDINLSVGVSHGWVPIGIPMTITKSEESRVYEIDGRSAIDVFSEYFGEENTALLQGEGDVGNAQALLTYPLGIMRPEGGDLIRMALKIYPDGSIGYASEMPQGSKVRIMFGSPTETIVAAQAAAKKCLEGLGETPPKALLMFNCIGRKNLYGKNADQEILAVQEILGKNIPLLGFYTYGEQAPVGGITKHMQNCENSFHNQTIVICALA